MNSIELSSFVYNDIYGSEHAKERYSSGRQYQYYKAVLGLHNKFFEDEDMHSKIFHQKNECSRDKNRSLLTRTYRKSNDTPDHFPNKYLMKKMRHQSLEISSTNPTSTHQQYRIEQLNNTTFRIRKHNPNCQIKSDLTKNNNNFPKYEHRNRNSRDIIREADHLRSLITYTSDPNRMKRSVEKQIKINSALRKFS